MKRKKFLLKSLVLSVALLIFVALAFVGCGDDETGSSSSTPQTGSSTVDSSAGTNSSTEGSSGGTNSSAEDSTGNVTCEHKGGTATCTEKAKCTECGAEYGGFAAHNEQYEVVEATCTKDGITNITCSNCDYTSTKSPTVATGHNMQFISKEELDILDDFVEIYECSSCNERVMNVISETDDHKYQVTLVVETTCQELGKIVMTCVSCGDEQVVYDEQKLSHQFEETVVLEPTCTEDGERDYLCAGCGKVGYKAGMVKVIPKLGHSYEDEGKEFAADAGVTFVAATCDKDGYFNRVCVNCNYDKDPITREEYETYVGTDDFDSTKYYDMEARGHDFSEFLREVSATCTTNGYEEYKCSRCSETTKEVCSEAYGHTYYKMSDAIEGEHYVIIKEATVDSEGLLAYKCIECSEVATEIYDMEVIPPLSKE